MGYFPLLRAEVRNRERNHLRAMPTALVAETVTMDEPIDVGVPLIKPVMVLTESPAGSPVAAWDVGEFDAVI